MPELPDGNVFRFGGKTSRGAKIFASPRPNFPSEQAKMRLTVYLVVSPALKAVRYWTGEGEVFWRVGPVAPSPGYRLAMPFRQGSSG